jgi:transposase InsO family protein
MMRRFYLNARIRPDGIFANDSIGPCLFLVRDNDRAYGHVFTSRVTAMGIRDRPISPGSPWQNGIAERLIGTLRRECLDHMVIFGETHLQRILTPMPRITIKRARTWLCIKIARSNGRLNALAALPQFPFWLTYTTIGTATSHKGSKSKKRFV